MPIKCDKNKNPFCTSSKEKLNNRNIDNHWVGHSMMKPVDAELFQKINDIQE